MTPNHSPLSQIKDLLDLLAVLSEKFDQVKTEEVKGELAKRIERTEGRLREGMRSLATGEGKDRLIVIGGDRKCASIAAASIIAKVTRDCLMTELDQMYPSFGFDRHKGYATREHLDRLAEFGPCPEHRRSFAPVRNVAQGRLTFGDADHGAA